MSKQVLSIDQMKHLKELGLNIERASFLVHVDSLRDKYSESHIFNTSTSNSLFEYEVETFPVFTLQDLFSLLPKKITASEHQCSEKGDFFLYIDYEYPEISYSVLDDWCPGLNELKTVYIDKDTELIDAAYEMLCWCLENGYVEKDFEDYETKV